MRQSLTASGEVMCRFLTATGEVMRRLALRCIGSLLHLTGEVMRQVLTAAGEVMRRLRCALARDALMRCAVLGLLLAHMTKHAV